MSQEVELITLFEIKNKISQIFNLDLNAIILKGIINEINLEIYSLMKSKQLIFIINLKNFM